MTLWRRSATGMWLGVCQYSTVQYGAATARRAQVVSGARHVKIRIYELYTDQHTYGIDMILMDTPQTYEFPS